MIFMTVLPPCVLVRHLDDDGQREEVTVPDQDEWAARLSQLRAVAYRTSNARLPAKPTPSAATSRRPFAKR